jgi:hypothetical protein
LSWRVDKRFDTSAVGLPTICSFATCQLRDVGWSTTGYRDGVDTFPLCPIERIIGVPDVVGPSYFCRTWSWWVDKSIDTSAVGLPTICSFATGQLRDVDWSTAGYRDGVDAFAICPIERVIGVPDVVGSSFFCRTWSWWVDKSVDASAVGLPTICSFAAGQLRDVGWSTTGYRDGIDAFAICPIKRVIRVPDVGSSYFGWTLSGRIIQLAQAKSGFLPSILCPTAGQFSVVASGVASDGENTMTLTPWQRVVGMKCCHRVAGGFLEEITPCLLLLLLVQLC